MKISRSILLRMGFFFKIRVVEKIKTHFMIGNFYPENMEKYRTARQTTDDNTTRSLPTEYWKPKATKPLRICNTYCLVMATMVPRTRLNVTLYVHCLSCF